MIKRLWHGCWFDHDLVRERKGKSYWLICERCGYGQKILPGQKFKARKPEKTPLAVVKMRRIG